MQVTNSVLTISVNAVAPVVDTHDSRVAVTGSQIVTPDDTIPLFPLGNGFRVQAGETRVWNTVDNTEYDTIRVEDGGTLFFARSVDTRLCVTNLQVLPGGTIDMGTELDPVTAKCELIFNDVASTDTEKYGTGFVGLGTVSTCGNPTSCSVPFAQEALAGTSTLSLAYPPVGWLPGHKLVLPDSQQKYWEIRPDNPSVGANYVDQTELVTIQSVSGNTVTLTAPIQFDHKGARDPDGVLLLLPDAANITRNVVWKSKNPAGNRAHVFFSRRAWINVHNTQFSSLGRTTNAVLSPTTNHVGRYAVHFHHVYGPVSVPAGMKQWNFSGNSVFCLMQPMPFRWGLAIHDTHFGRAAANAVYNWAGAGIVTGEEGNETSNEFEDNFVCRITGTGGAGQPYGRSAADTGTEGVAIWSRSNLNILRRNIAANCHKGYSFWSEGLNNAQVPTGPGADSAVSFTVVNMEGTALAANVDNVSYGGITAVAMSIYNVGMKFYTPWPGIGESVLKGFKGWHVYDKLYYNYKTKSIVFEDVIGIGDSWCLVNGRSAPVGFFSGDYVQEGFTIRGNSRIEGFLTGIDSSMGVGQQFVDVRLRNYKNFVFAPQWWLLSAKDLPARDVTITRPAFVPHPAINRSDWGAKANVFLDGRIVSRNSSVIKQDVIRLAQYNGHTYRLYWPEQAASYVLPANQTQSNGTVEIEGSGAVALSNSAAFAQFGIAFAGSIVPANAAPLAGVIGSAVQEL